MRRKRKQATSPNEGKTCSCEALGNRTSIIVEPHTYDIIDSCIGGDEFTLWIRNMSDIGHVTSKPLEFTGVYWLRFRPIVPEDLAVRCLCVRCGRVIDVDVGKGIGFI